MLKIFRGVRGEGSAEPAPRLRGQRPQKRHIEASRLVPLAATAVFAIALGCGQTDVRGTYDVEIEILRAAGPIAGTLILSTGHLDVPAMTADDRKEAGDWIESDTIDANSCFVIEGGSGDEKTPQSVRVFDAQIGGKGVELPIEIYRTSLQNLEIVRLQFFANTIGGDVILTDRGQQLPGRLHGVRLDSAKPEKCLEDLETFRTLLRNSPAE